MSALRASTGGPENRNAGEKPSRAPKVEKLSDTAARERIRTDHDTTLIVEAAAGTGKTTAVARRLVEFLGAGTAGIGQLADAMAAAREAGARITVLASGVPGHWFEHAWTLSIATSDVVRPALGLVVRQNRRQRLVVLCL